MLVHKGVDVNAGIDKGYTGLQLAIQQEHTAVAEYLISLPGCDLEARDSEGNTALHTACYFHSNTDIVKRLVQKGVDVNAGIDKGYTGLHLAIQQEHTAVAEYLISLPGCDLEARDSEGARPLHYACYCHSNIDIVKMLVHKGVDVNAGIDNGHTGLHLAIKQEYTAVAEYLISLPGCDLEARCSEGARPLHYACLRHSNIDIVKILIDKGVVVNEGTDDGDTALDLAKANNNTNIITLLEKSACGTPANVVSKGQKGVVSKRQKSVMSKVQKSVVSKEQTSSSMQHDQKQLQSFIQCLQEELDQFRCSEQTGYEDMKQQVQNMQRDLKTALVKIEELRITTEALGSRARPKKKSVTHSRSRSGHRSRRSRSNSRGSRSRRRMSSHIKQQVDTMQKDLETALVNINKLTINSEPQGASAAAVGQAAQMPDLVREASSLYSRCKSARVRQPGLTDNHLLEIAEELGNDWKTLGGYLGISLAKIQRIIQNHPGEALFCVWIMLVEWRDGHQGDLNAKREDLKKALRRNGKMNLVELV